MQPSDESPFQVFDPTQPYTVFERRLPHWSQPGTLSFITWRTWDSIPARVLQAWLTERDAWLSSHGIRPGPAWKARLERLDPALVPEFHRDIAERWNGHLDACHGACVLRRPQLAKIVADSLRHFDGERYDLMDFVVMPNHVHVLAAFRDEETMLAQCESWKHFTATAINRTLGRSGRFWQQDGFDHLVRSLEQFIYLRGYIAGNPVRAKLAHGDYFHYSKPM